MGEELPKWSETAYSDAQIVRLRTLKEGYMETLGLPKDWPGDWNGNSVGREIANMAPMSYYRMRGELWRSGYVLGCLAPTVDSLFSEPRYARKSTISTMQSGLEGIVKDIKAAGRQAPNFDRSQYDTRIPKCMSSDGTGRLGALALCMWGMPTPLEVGSKQWRVPRETQRQRQLQEEAILADLGPEV